VQVAGQVGDQSGAVGVVAEDAVGTKTQRIYRTGALGAWTQALSQFECGFLERYSDVRPRPPAAMKTATLSAKPSSGARMAHTSCPARSGGQTRRG